MFSFRLGFDPQKDLKNLWRAVQKKGIVEDDIINSTKSMNAINAIRVEIGLPVVPSYSSIAKTLLETEAALRGYFNLKA